MSIHTEYSCSECGFKFIDSPNIFWIDNDKNVHVDRLTVDSSAASSEALASGGIYKYYCYNCNNFIYNFHILTKSQLIEKEEIIQLIELMDSNLKTIDFDNSFQNCISCRKEMPLKMEKSFAIDETGEFFIGDSLEDMADKQLDFSGKYYGYYCDECSKQVNKFVILDNDANLDDSLIKEILKDHTNDLTVFINDTYSICPNCGDELHVLSESSVCPACRVGVLNISRRIVSD